MYSRYKFSKSWELLKICSRDMEKELINELIEKIKNDHSFSRVDKF
jgi:hypothetical protein